MSGVQDHAAEGAKASDRARESAPGSAGSDAAAALRQLGFPAYLEYLAQAGQR